MEFEDTEKLSSALGKLLRLFFHKYVPFESWIQVSGQLCVMIEGGQSMDFFVSEKVCKTSETSTNITANSHPIVNKEENVQHFHKLKVKFQDLRLPIKDFSLLQSLTCCDFEPKFQLKKIRSKVA